MSGPRTEGELVVVTRSQRELVDITEQLHQALAEAGVGDGVCQLYCPHTTAGVTVNEGADPGSIMFGLSRESDERSLVAFLQLFSQPQLLASLVPRLRDEELHGLVDSLTALMRRHLREEEYHRLFLGERP